MTARRFTGALLVSGALTLGPIFATAAAASVAPPSGPTPGCRGDDGVGSVSRTSIVVGSEVGFSACGFAPGTSVVEEINGANPINLLADGDGRVANALKGLHVGANIIKAIGAEWVPPVAPTPTPTPTMSPTSASTTVRATAALARRGGFRVEAAAALMRTVSAVVVVLPRAPASGPAAPNGANAGAGPAARAVCGGPGSPLGAGSPGGAASPGGAGSPDGAQLCGGSAGRLPFTGAETGLLAGVALALTVAGVALRVVGRRRRVLATDRHEG